MADLKALVLNILPEFPECMELSVIHTRILNDLRMGKQPPVDANLITDAVLDLHDKKKVEVHTGGFCISRPVLPELPPKPPEPISLTLDEPSGEAPPVVDATPA